MKVKGNGWEANHAFSDSHEVGRFIKEDIGEVKAVRVFRGSCYISESACICLFVFCVLVLFCNVLAVFLYSV